MTEASYEQVEDAAEKRKDFSVSGVLKQLGISTSGYYEWKKRGKSQQQIRKERIVQRIREIHMESFENYGAPKITHILRERGEVISERTVGKYMRENGIRAQYVKPYIATTRDSDFSSRLKNILKREFNPTKPNTVWCTDITYIWTHEEGFVYLTSIMDLYSRKIISWKLSRSMEVEEVLECLKQAKQRRKMENPLVIHSDRGSQYVSWYYMQLSEGMQRSYSEKGTPWDNACIESFHSLIKREWLNRYKIMNYDMAYQFVFEYVETFYNTVRIHRHCDYMSPNAYEKLYESLKISI